jgi:hypothetical protein
MQLLRIASLLTLFCLHFGVSAQAQRATGLQFLDETAYQSIPLAVTPALGVLPVRVDHSNDFPEPGDQGPQGSCVGWAVSYLKAYQERIERKWTSWTPERVFSPAYIYNQLNRTPDCSGGTFIAEALNLVRREGSATQASFPYRPNSCSTLPDEIVRQLARPYAIADWRRVNVQDDVEIKSHMASGFPVLIGAMVDDAFMQLGPQTYQARGGAVRGGHAMVAVGYDDSRSAIKILNSWGKTWGQAGYGWISYAMFKSMTREAYVAQDIVTVPSPSPVVITPPPVRQRIVISAASFARGSNVAVGQCGPYGNGVLLNAAPCNARPNAAEWDFVAPAPGAYQLIVEYASAQNRPVRVRIDGQLVASSALADPTGCFTENCQEARPQAVVQLTVGPHVLRLERDNVFPHIRTITFEPTQ